MSWVENPSDANLKLKDSRSAYTFNTQYYGTAILFFIVKMVRPDTHAGCSTIKSKLENTNIPEFKYDIPKANLNITECMNEISIDGETYSEIASHKLNLYSTS